MESKTTTKKPTLVFSAYTNPGPKPISHITATLLFLLALPIRFYNLSNPNEIVFDEVHFGGFASNYILSKFFFDVHPPVDTSNLAWQTDDCIHWNTLWLRWYLFL
jgi:dolichyl-phosphate-mannose--protein O-mannosyl transferase